MVEINILNSLPHAVDALPHPQLHHHFLRTIQRQGRSQGEIALRKEFRDRFSIAGEKSTEVTLSLGKKVEVYIL